MLNEVLPVLNTLSQTFQKGTYSFDKIKGSIDHAKHALNKLTEVDRHDTFLKQLKEDLAGHLAPTGLTLADSMEIILGNLKMKYITSLVTNIESRFSKCAEIFTAFKIFDPERIPRYMTVTKMVLL